jgi:hypothetical protein
MKHARLVLVCATLFAGTLCSAQTATIEHPRRYLFGIKISFLALPRQTDQVKLTPEPQSFGSFRIAQVDGTVLVWDGADDIIVSSRQIPFSVKVSGFKISIKH